MIFLCHVATPAIREGFLPAARRLGRPVTILTDKPEQYRDYPEKVLACDVFNPVAILDCLTQHQLEVAAVFSNSDHLQTQCALVGQFFGVPHKSARACYLAKNKNLMRQEMAALGLETMRFQQFNSLQELEKASDLWFPCVAKPARGVASLNVKYLESRSQLLEFASKYWSQAPEENSVPLLLEEYLPGTIYSVETLGDGQHCHLLGGFTCQLSELPYFIETEARWGVPPEGADYVLKVLQALGATFGACHTEWVMAPQGPRIIEVNYRSVGDQSDFMLNNLLSGRYFEYVLRTSLGESIQPPTIPAHWHSSAHYLYAERAGRLSQAPGGFIEQREQWSVHFLPTKQAQDTIELSHSNKDYLGMLHVTGPGYAQVEGMVQQETLRLRKEYQWQ